MRRVEQMRPPATQHRPPTRCWRLDTEAEKAQCRFADDRASHAECRLYDDDRDHCWNHMAYEHPRRRRAERLCRLDELELSGAKNLTAYQSGISHPPDNGQREQHVAETGPEHCD